MASDRREDSMVKVGAEGAGVAARNLSGIGNNQLGLGKPGIR